MTKKKTTSKRRLTSPFVTFILNSILISLIAGVCFVFLLYRTESIYDYNNLARATFREQLPINVARIITDLSNRDGTTADEQVERVPEMSRNATEEEIYQALLAAGYSENKARGLAMAYSVTIDAGYDSNVAIGFMANFHGEGDYGQVQYGMTVPNWDGPGQDKRVPNGVYVPIASEANLQATEARGRVSGNKIGFGIAQWTYYTRVAHYCEVYRRLFGNPVSGEITYDNRATADRTMFSEEIKGYMTKIASRESTVTKYQRNSPESWAYAVCYEYERPANIEDAAQNRAGQAGNIYNAIKGVITKKPDIPGNPPRGGGGNNQPIDKSDTVFFGDSRTVGMCKAMGFTSIMGANTANGKASDGVYYISEGGKGISILKDNLGKLASINCSTVIIALGVNDIGNAGDYKSTATSLAQQGYNVIFLSVGPIEPARYNGTMLVTQAQIDAFNSKLASGSGYTFKDLTGLSYKTTDGLHYDDATYKRIYDAIF